MGETQAEQHAIFRFSIPDTSVSASERALFAFAAPKETVEHDIVLRDATTDPNIVKGSEGLDAQGFTYIKHQSALTKSDIWFSGQNVEDIYIPEVEDLVCKITGAKRAVVNNIAFRRRTADKQVDPNFVLKRDSDLDREIALLPKDTALVYGKDAGGSLEPARNVHCDYNPRGLRRTARYCRKDICEAAKDTLAIENANETSEINQGIPRYAAYSVWRPVRTVYRDPIAVLDWRSLDESDMESQEYRALSNVTSTGEYMMDSWHGLPPKQPEKQRWYWMPEQTPEDVLIIKFADTQSEKDPNVAGACLHCSPHVLGTENEEPRQSIEARVLAFW